MSEMFHLKEVSFEQWGSYWRRVPKTNLLQSWQYGEAKAQAEGWRVIRFVISEKNGHPLALAQMLTRSLPFLGGIARLNRGPLLLDDFADDQSVARTLKILEALLQEARRRCWWVVQIAPELPDISVVFNGLTQMGMRRRPEPAFASGRLALTTDDESIMMGFNGKWRNCMRKGVRLGVLVTNHKSNGPELDLLIRHYAVLQQSKNFGGLSEGMIKCLARQQSDDWQFNLFIARESNVADNDEPIGSLVTVRHGDSATYIIGTTNEKGRNMQANSVLLWNAILHAKHVGCNWFDIGGLNSVTTKGIAQFKQGLNAVPYALTGEWRWYFFPIIHKVENLFLKRTWCKNT